MKPNKNWYSSKQTKKRIELYFKKEIENEWSNLRVHYK